MPEDAFSLAENLLISTGVGDAAAIGDDPGAARARYFAAVRAIVSSPADKEVKSSESHIERVRERDKQRCRACGSEERFRGIIHAREWPHAHDDQMTTARRGGISWLTFQER